MCDDIANSFQSFGLFSFILPAAYILFHVFSNDSCYHFETYLRILPQSNEAKKFACAESGATDARSKLQRNLNWVVVSIFFIPILGKIKIGAPKPITRWWNFKYFFFTPILWKISNLTSIFFRWVGSTTNQLTKSFNFQFFSQGSWRREWTVTGGNTSVPVPMVMRRDAPQDFWYFLFQRVWLCFLSICPPDEVYWDMNQLENPEHIVEMLHAYYFEPCRVWYILYSFVQVKLYSSWRYLDLAISISGESCDHGPSSQNSSGVALQNVVEAYFFNAEMDAPLDAPIGNMLPWECFSCLIWVKFGLKEQTGLPSSHSR